MLRTTRRGEKEGKWRAASDKRKQGITGTSLFLQRNTRQEGDKRPELRGEGRSGTSAQNLSRAHKATRREDPKSGTQKTPQLLNSTATVSFPKTRETSRSTSRGHQELLPAENASQRSAKCAWQTAASPTDCRPSFIPHPVYGRFPSHAKALLSR